MKPLSKRRRLTLAALAVLSLAAMVGWQAAPDAFTFVVENGVRAIQLLLPLRNVTTTDLNSRILVDGGRYPLTAAGIQAAINDANNTGSREVWLPCGNVNINATLTITHGGFKLRGCGAGFTDAGTLPATVLTYTGAAGGDLLQVTGLQSARIDRVILENFILDCNALCRYASRWEKVDEYELHGVRQRGNGATGAAMYQVDATGGKLINSWFSQCSTYCLASDWGSGGFWWAGGGVDTLVANSNPLVLVQGAVNAWHITGVEMDASGAAAFAGFIQVNGFDTNSSFASAPTGGAGAPIQVTISDSSFFMKAGSGAPSQGADILITGTATNPSQAAVLERLYFGGLSISAAAVKYDRTQRAVFQNSYTTGHVTSSLITTANTNTPAMGFVVSGDPLRCTGANCGVLLDLTVDPAAGRLASLAGFVPAAASGGQLGSALLPFSSLFFGSDGGTNVTQLLCNWRGSGATACGFDAAAGSLGTFGINVGTNFQVAVVGTGITTTDANGFASLGYRTNSNCQLGGATGTTSPAACGSAAAGMIAVPASQTTYTVNTTAAQTNSEIFVQQMSDNSGLPSSPTCSASATVPIQSSRVAGTSFTITQTSVAAVTCFKYWIVNR